jgi:hypothetical protein
MNFRVKITPNFNTKEIIDTTISNYWRKFQERALKLGYVIHEEVRKHIRSNTRRDGNTGNLVRNIDFHLEAPTGFGKVFWGVGSIDNLNQSAPYWYVINYGKTVFGLPYVPNNGNFIPGYFRGGDGRPDSSKRGSGRDSFYYRPQEASSDRPGDIGGMTPKTPIRGMNYIQHGTAILNNQLRQLIAQLKREKTAL